LEEENKTLHAKVKDLEHKIAVGGHDVDDFDRFAY
jgi:uncharacterized protein (UPF0335 family)